MKLKIIVALILLPILGAFAQILGPIAFSPSSAGVSPSTVTDCGGFDNGFVGTLTLTVTCSAAVGDEIVIFSSGDTTAVTTFTPSDSVGNTWSGTPTVQSHLFRYAAFHSAPILSGKTYVSGSSTVTMGFSVSTHWHIEVFKISNPSASPVDQTFGGEPSGDNNSNPMSLSWVTGSATTQATEIVLAGVVICGVDPFGAYGTGYTGLYHLLTTNGAGSLAEWKRVTSTGTQTATATAACGFQQGDALTATYKAN